MQNINMATGIAQIFSTEMHAEVETLVAYKAISSSFCSEGWCRLEDAVYMSFSYEFLFLVNSFPVGG